MLQIGMSSRKKYARERSAIQAEQYTRYLLHMLSCFWVTRCLRPSLISMRVPPCLCEQARPPIHLGQRQGGQSRSASLHSHTSHHWNVCLHSCLQSSVSPLCPSWLLCKTSCSRLRGCLLTNPFQLQQHTARSHGTGALSHRSLASPQAPVKPQSGSSRSCPALAAPCV